MEEKKIKIDTNTTLPDVVGSIRRGEWKIPRFQREFVWEKRKVIELFDSIYKGFPIGSFFLWVPPEEYADYYKDIPELEIKPASTKYYTHFILDGQQRLTSLYVTYRGLKIEGFDYSDICFDLDTDNFNTEKKDTERNISVHHILSSEEFPEIYDNLTSERKRKFNKVRDIFSKYPFPIIVIEDKSIEEACKIFERINQGGKRLSIFDLVVAVTWSKDFELKREIDKFNSKIQGSFGKIPYEVFTETLSLIINGQCTRAFQLKLNPSDAKSRWQDVVESLGQSIQFLRANLKVRSYEYLPYRDMLPLIAYYLNQCKVNGAEVDRKFIEEWFWKVAFSNRYSGSSFNKMGEDRAYIFDRKLRGEPVNIDYNLAVNVDRIKALNMGRKTALRDALILIMIQQEPISFIDNTVIDIEKDSIADFNRSEKHHIFPRKFLKSIGIKEKKATDLLVNFCLIDSALNKAISGKSPKEYFTRFSDQNPELKEALARHLINFENDSAIWSNQYGEFIEQRADILFRQVKKRIGDFTATIEEEMETNPALLIQKLEREIRETINNILYESYGENWWDAEGVVPQDVRDYAKEKIKREKANKPYISEQEWELPLRRLEQVNIMDYLKIINKNWGNFEDIFGSKANLQRYLDGFSTIRNQIDHIKTIDPTERKFGETSIEWLLKCVQKWSDKEAEDESGYAVGSLFVNELYQLLKSNILGLDSEIIEKDNKHYKAFSKRNNFCNFASLHFRKDHILVRILVRKGELDDPRSITRDETDREEKEIRRIYFQVKSKEDIEYALQLIQQSYQFNEWYISQKKTELKPRHYERHEFWTGLLELAREENADFQNLSPTYNHWLGKGGGKSGVSLNFIVLQKSARIEIYLDIGNKVINTQRYDYLHERRSEIEGSFGDELGWYRLDDKRASAITYNFQGIGLKTKDKWPELQKEMVEKMMLLEKVFAAHIPELE